VRVKPLEALKHPFFDELRDQKTTLPNGTPLPDFFNFTTEESSSVTTELMDALIPKWYKKK
jgi:hypothetical protein